MNAAHVVPPAADFPVMDNRGRGSEIKRRRLALGISGIRPFAEATGRDRQTLTRVEAGDERVSAATLDWLEAWLDRQEEENGLAENGIGEVSPIRVTFHDVTTSSIGEIIVEGPSDQPDELVATIARLLAEVRKGGDK